MEWFKNIIHLKHTKNYILLFGIFILINSLKALGNEDKLHYRKGLNTYDFEWSPNSKQILFQATEKFGADANYLDRSIYQVRAPGGTPRKLFETPG